MIQKNKIINMSRQKEKKLPGNSPRGPYACTPPSHGGQAISQAIEQSMYNDHALSLSNGLDDREMERTDEIFH